MPGDLIFVDYTAEDFIENETAGFSADELEAVIDAYEATYGSRRATFVSTASHDHGLVARCPALDDLIGAMDASGEEECCQAGIFRSMRGRGKRYESRAHRQFPQADLN